MSCSEANTPSHRMAGGDVVGTTSEAGPVRSDVGLVDDGYPYG